MHVTISLQEQRPTFEHLLLPRVTGFAACVDSFVCAANSAHARDDGAGGGSAGDDRGSGRGARGAGLIQSALGGVGGRRSERPAYSNRVVYDVTVRASPVF